jgi:3D (Asp-Asp-Asp) domain-containing protein
MSDRVDHGVIGLLFDWVDRIVNRLKSLAPLAMAFGLGCEQPPASEPVPVPVRRAELAVAKPAPVAEPKPLGDFNITFFYVVEETPRPKNDNAAELELASIAPAAPASTTLWQTDGRGTCTAIADVTPDFAQQLRIQGTGKLADGRVLNIWGACPCDRSPCFKVTPTAWGTGGSGRQLQPFRSVAVDPRVVKLGTRLYVPLLDGKRMPGRRPWGGFVHDGCVRADDVGGGIKGTQLDLFVGRRGWFLGITKHEGAHEWARQVPVFDGTKRCAAKPVRRRAGAKS